MLGSPDPEPEESTFGAGCTPNVIGAQEVYRDPRERIKQEKMRNQAKPALQGPEKLSFKEKMKMFAMEGGGGVHDSSARDKVKHSKAQREIEGEEAPKEATTAATTVT